MAGGKKAQADAAVIEILKLEYGQLDCYVLGRTPMYLNSMSAKAAQQLLLGGIRKNRTERQTTLKHDPYAEYRASCYRSLGDDAPTRIRVKSTAFKGAMRNAALRIPGATKTEIGQLTYVEGLVDPSYVDVYGVPYIACDITRSADAAKTPDVRTRAILPQWAAALRVTYTRPLISERAVGHLLAAAGRICGVGDWRIEKGSGDFGQFDLCEPDDPRYLAIVEAGGRVAQDAALQDPTPVNHETAELLTWFHGEVERRGFREPRRIMVPVPGPADGKVAV